MRWRDLETGCYLTRDPAGFVDGPNLYAYVRQNPWSSIDGEGEFAQVLANPAVIGGIVVGAAVLELGYRATHRGRPSPVARAVGNAIRQEITDIATLPTLADPGTYKNRFDPGGGRTRPDVKDNRPPTSGPQTQPKSDTNNGNQPKPKPKRQRPEPKKKTRVGDRTQREIVVVGEGMGRVQAYAKTLRQGGAKVVTRPVTYQAPNMQRKNNPNPYGGRRALDANWHWLDYHARKLQKEVHDIGPDGRNRNANGDPVPGSPHYELEDRNLRRWEKKKEIKPVKRIPFPIRDN